MPREDYEKFLKVARNELPENLFLQTGKTDDDFPMNFAKLRNSDTTFIETSVKNFKINHGVFIDIFPLDGYSDSKWFKLMNRIYISRINLEYVLPFTAKKTMFRKMRHWILRTVFPDYRRARDLREKLIRKRQYNESKFVINYCGAWGEREVMSRDTFGSGCKATFEGI